MSAEARHVAAALERIAELTDPAALRGMLANARAKGAETVGRAALLRLAEILPEATPGSVEHDFWRTIHIFEEMLTDERGRTTRLSRTRQKITRVGVLKTLEDFCLARSATDGFRMLIERGLPELTGEAVVLRHADRFPEPLLAAARARLSSSGVDLAALPLNQT